MKAKISLFCNVEKDAVITAKDVESIYEVPLFFHQEGLDDKIVERLNIWTRAPRLENWIALNEKIKNLSDSVKIAVVGKYIHLRESYKSLNEALFHGGIANNCKVILDFIDSEELEKQGADPRLAQADGILIPGWLWLSRGRGENLGHSIRPGEKGSLLRDLSGHAIGGY